MKKIFISIFALALMCATMSSCNCSTKEQQEEPVIEVIEETVETVDEDSITEDFEEVTETVSEEAAE